MSKRMKLLVSVLVAVVLLTVGGTATVMAQEEKSAPAPDPSTKIFMTTANTTGLLARVAEILGVSQDELTTAFKKARQEMSEEAFTNYLNKAVEEGLITQGEAKEIEDWWLNRPEAAGRLFPHASSLSGKQNRQMMTIRDKVRARCQITEEKANGTGKWQEQSSEALDRPAQRARISQAKRSRQMIAVPKGWGGPRTPELTN